MAQSFIYSVTVLLILNLCSFASDSKYVFGLDFTGWLSEITATTSYLNHGFNKNPGEVVSDTLYYGDDHFGFMPYYGFRLSGKFYAQISLGFFFTSGKRTAINPYTGRADPAQNYGPGGEKLKIWLIPSLEYKLLSRLSLIADFWYYGGRKNYESNIYNDNRYRWRILGKGYPGRFLYGLTGLEFIDCPTDDLLRTYETNYGNGFTRLHLAYYTQRKSSIGLILGGGFNLPINGGLHFVGTATYSFAGDDSFIFSSGLRYGM